MLTELPGLILSRTIPEHCIWGVATGAYKIFGGVIRDSSGQIVAHLVNTAPHVLGSSPLSVIAEGVNTIQLYKIGQSVASLEKATASILSVAQGTAILSGLTLAVSIGGFAFLSSRLSRIDKRLTELSKEVKAIQSLLASQERASLNSALQTLSVLMAETKDDIRIPLLVASRQAIGAVYQRYREQLQLVQTVDEALAIEEYFAITTLSHALCTAELGMQQAAAAELDSAYQYWAGQTRRICQTTVLQQPERFLTPAFPDVKTAELIDWLDFGFREEKGISWIDDLREKSTGFRMPRFGQSDSDKLSIELLRKFCSRNRVLQGYVSQYQYFAEHKMRPSEYRDLVNSLSSDNTGANILVLVAHAS